MKALRTQFDADDFAGVVATPTCSSCCCCSCCVATVVGAGAIAAAATATAAPETGRSRAAVLRLGVLAALIPLLSLLAALGILWAISETVGVQLAVALLLIFGFLAAGYSYLFRALRGSGAAGLAVTVAFLVLLSLAVEAAIAMPLVLSEFPAAYLIVPAVALAALAGALTRPAVRERLARTVRRGEVGPDGPPQPRR
ncbi:MAG: hypothetical protein LCH76_01615 [Actinobacteria bacterium]|nr:hypothetical protein [Actinomycetota bacterium]